MEMINDDIFLTKEIFSEIIESKVLAGMTYFEAVLEFSEESDKESEDLLPFMSKVILDKVRQSATAMGLIDLKEGNLDSFCD